MSGGAAAIEATAAIARLGMPVRLITVVGATENLPSGHAIKPGDIVTAANGRTIEINNTDAEGRLVLADCLCHAVAEGAERIVDLATLTGAVIVALGSTHAGLMSNDEELAGRIAARRPSGPARSSGGCPCTRSTTSSSRAPTPTSTTPPKAARRGRSSAGPSSRTSSARCHGRTSTSPARPGISNGPTSARAPRATACACSWSWRGRTPPSRAGRASQSVTAAHARPRGSMWARWLPCLALDLDQLRPRLPPPRAAARVPRLSSTETVSSADAVDEQRRHLEGHLRIGSRDRVALGQLLGPASHQRPHRAAAPQPVGACEVAHAGLPDRPP